MRLTRHTNASNWVEKQLWRSCCGKTLFNLHNVACQRLSHVKCPNVWMAQRVSVLEAHLLQHAHIYVCIGLQTPNRPSTDLKRENHYRTYRDKYNEITELGKRYKATFFFSFSGWFHNEASSKWPFRSPGPNIGRSSSMTDNDRPLAPSGAPLNNSARVQLAAADHSDGDVTHEEERGLAQRMVTMMPRGHNLLIASRRWYTST